MEENHVCKAEKKKILKKGPKLCGPVYVDSPRKIFP